MTGMNEYEYDGGDLVLTDAMKTDYERDGFIIIRNLLNQQELDIIEEAIQGEGSLTSYAYGNDDGDSGIAKMCIWDKIGKDTTGAFASTRKVAGTASKLIGAEVFHYHSKITMKDARSGGKFVWHQDYGYWYNFGCLFPDMLTVFTALDRCDTENGCLQIMRGSHRCGRIDHGRISGGDQEGADLERVALLDKCLETLPVILNPGDTLFLHANLLHCSGRNASARRRWALLSCYSKADNIPTPKTFLSGYTPLEILDNDAIIQRGVSRDLTGKEVSVKDGGDFVYHTYFK